VSTPGSSVGHDTLTLPQGAANHGNLAALARLAFGSSAALGQTGGPRHLSLLPAEALDLDLSDPEQRRLGDYELLEKLGQGGMGVVYRARQLSLDREVALKLLAAGPWGSDDFIGRFQREAQSAARLAHPNIVPIFEIGAQDGLNYFSMQLVRGAALAQVLAEKGPFEPRRAASLLQTIAEAVDYAHRLGLLHLDLKPANVLLDADQVPHVADFGLARPLDSSLGVDTDEVSGTPSYMAPEQAQLKSHRLSAATDIYGLGAIGFELLSGRPPFLGATPQQTLQRVLHDEAPTLHSLRGGLPADLEAIVQRCLSKDPRDRYVSARALADDLGRFLDGRPVHARPLHAGQRLLRWTRREPRLSGLAALLLLSLIGGLVSTSTQWQRAEGHAAEARQTLWDARSEQAWQEVQRGNSPGALRLIASNLAELDVLPGNTTQAALQRRRIGALQALGPRWIDHRQLEHTGTFGTAISHDGGLLAVGAHREEGGRRQVEVQWLRSSDLQTLGAAALTDTGGNPASNLRQIAFTSDGAGILASEDWGADKVSPPGIRMHLVDLQKSAAVGWPEGFAQPQDATFAADGRHALLRDTLGQVQVWQLAPWRALGPPVAAPADANWLLDPRHGVLLVAHDQMRRLERWQLPELQSRSSIALPGATRLTAWALAADGRQLAVADDLGKVFLVSLDATDASGWLIGSVGEQRVRALSFSADGGWLAAANDGGSVRAWDLAQGRPLFRGLELGLRVFSLSLDRDSGLLLAGTRDGLHLHRLAEFGTGPAPTVALADPIKPLGWFGAFPAAADFKSGLMFSADQGGWLRLWRLPRTPILQARAARQVESGYRFDGRHVVQVEDARVRVIDAWTGAGASEWVELAQIPGFATLTRDARYLLISEGTRLHGYDWRRGVAIGQPIELSGTPTRLALSPGRQQAVLAVPAAVGRSYREMLSLVDVDRWHVAAGPVEVDGWIGMFDVSPDGEHIRIARMDAPVEILRCADLRPLDWVASEVMSWGATFSSDGRSLLAGSRSDGPPTAMRRWSLPAGQAATIASAPALFPVLDLPAGRGVVGVNERGGDVLTRLLLRPDGSMVPLPRPTIATGGNRYAYSTDGALVADSRAYSIILAESDRGSWASPPLPTGLAEPDRVVDISIDPTGSALLARSHMGHWLLYSLPASATSAKELLAQARLLDRSPADAGELAQVERPARESLRQADPGPWSTGAVARNRAATGLPPRTAGTPRHALDLSPHYNFDLDGILASPNENYMSAEYRAIAPGTQRIGGVVYDIRGGIQFGPALDGAPGAAVPFAITGDTGPIALPRGVYRAVHALVTAQSMGSARALDLPVAYLELNWRYADGSSANSTLRHAEDMHWHRDSPRREARNAAWLMPRSVSVMNYSGATLLHSVRVANPQPQREVVAVSLRVPSTPGYLPYSALFALSLEDDAAERLP